MEEQIPHLKEVVEHSLERLDAQIQKDPIGTIFAGITIGAGLGALRASELKQGALMLLKVLASEAINDLNLDFPDRTLH